MIEIGQSMYKSYLLDINNPQKTISTDTQKSTRVETRKGKNNCAKVYLFFK